MTAPMTGLPPVTNPSDYEFDGAIFRQQYAEYLRLKQASLGMQLAQTNQGAPASTVAAYAPPTNYQLLDDDKLIGAAMAWGATRAQAQVTPREELVKWLEFNRQAARPSDAESNAMINGAAALSMMGLGAVQGLNRGLRAIPLVGEAYDRYLGGRAAAQKLAGMEELVRASTPESIQTVLSGEQVLGHVGAMWAPSAATAALIGRAGMAATGIGALGVGNVLARTAPITRGAVHGIATTFALEGGSEEVKENPLLWYTVGAGLGVLAPLGAPAMQWGADYLNRLRTMFQGQQARASRAYTPGWTRPPEADASGVTISDGPMPTGPGAGQLGAPMGMSELPAGTTRLPAPAVKLLNRGTAVESAEAQALGFTKADMVLNAPDSEVLLASPVLDDVTVLRAATSSNPGGVSLVHSITDPGALVEYAVENGLSVNIVTRNGRQSALLSDVNLPPTALAEYEQFGVFSGQTVRHTRGNELIVQSITPDGQAAVSMKYGGKLLPPITMPVSELAPSVRSQALQIEPELWDEFLDTASQRAFASVGELTGTQHADMADHILRTNMVKYLDEFLDSKAIVDPGQRARIGNYFNERYVDSYKQLAPVEVAAAEQAELALLAARGADIVERPMAYLDELASSRGFVITPTGDGRFELIDTLGEQLPPSSELAATQSRVWDTPEEVAAYLHQLDRELPDITPLGDVPVEAFGGIAGDVPTNVPASAYPRGLADTLDELAEDFGTPGNPDPSLAAEARLLREEAAADGLAAMGEYAVQRRGGGGSGRGPGSGGNGGWPEQPRLRGGVPRAINTINRATLQLSNQRRLFAVLDDMLEEAGAGDLRLYGEGQAILRTEDARSNMYSRMTDDFMPIVQDIRVSMRRSGTWTRIYEIEDDGLRLLAADRAGLNQKEIAAFDATARMMHKWFGETGLAAERELRRYMPHIQKAMATGKWEPVETLMRQGKVHPMTEAFMMKARTGAINVRELDPEQLFITYASSLANETSGYNAALKAMTDKWTRLKQEWPEVGPVAQYVDGWLHSLQYGHTPGADAALDAAHVVLQKLVGPSVTRHNARQLVNFGLNMNYKALLGLRLPTVIRNLGQIALATPRLPTQIPEVLREFISNPAAKREIMERAVNIGTLSLQPQRAVAPGAVRDLQEIAMRELDGPVQAVALTRREQAVAKMLAATEDLIPDWMRSKKVQPMYWFSQTDELMRAVVGEAGLRKAQTALAAYAKSDKSANAMQVLMEDSGVLSFYPAAQREFKKKVASGLYGEAAIDLAREQVAASMFFYGPGRGPLIGNTLSGKLGTQISSYALNTLQTLEEVYRYGGSTATKVAMGATLAGVTLALAEAQRRTGWSFNKMNPYAGAVPTVGGPTLRAGLDVAGNVTQGVNELVQGNVPGALQQVQQASGTMVEMFNPVRGAFETVGALNKAQQSPLPGTATARYLLLGDKSATPDLERYNPFYNPTASPQQLVPQQGPVRSEAFGLPTIPQRPVTPMSPQDVVDTAWFNSLPQELQSILRQQRTPEGGGGGAMQ